MADTVQTAALIVLAQEYRGDIVKQANRRSAAARMLKIKRGGGKNISWVAKSTGAIAENYSEGADAANFGSDGQASAILGWPHYRANFHVSGTALRTARTAIQPLGNVALWAENLVEATNSLISLLNQKMFSGDGTGTEMSGLDAAIGSTSNTYATIDRSSQAYWRPTVVDPGVSTALTFAQIRSDRAAIYKLCGVKPDLAFCHPDVFNTVGALFDNSRRYVYDVTTARGPIKLEAGYGALEVDGMIFVEDKDATANRIYYLNSDYVHLEYLPGEEATPDFPTMQLAADDGFGPIPLGFTYEALAKAGDSKKAEVLSNVGIVVRRPNACGMRKNVAVVS